MENARTVRPFTGRHAAAIIVAFFAVVVGVNFTMARLASSTFGGLVVENSYVASQDFNTWLAEAEKERALGWRAEFAREADGRLTMTLLDAQGRPLDGAQVTVDAVHPLGRAPDHVLAIEEAGPGRYVAALGPGRWRLRASVAANGQAWRTMGEVR